MSGIRIRTKKNEPVVEPEPVPEPVLDPEVIIPIPTDIITHGPRNIQEMRAKG